MTPPAAGRAALPILIAAAALPGLALGRPGTTSADTPTASSVAITGSAGTDNEYHAGDTITPTVTFSTAIASHSSASRAIDVGGVDRSSTLDSTAAGAPTVANAARCAAAFPARSHSHGCPDTAAADTNPGPGLGCALTRDLDFNDGAPGDRTYDSHYNSNAGWTPIANGSTRYSGIFEGNGHAIANLYINSTGLYAGLFGQLAAGGTIREVGIADARVTGTSSSFLFAGAPVGYNFGTITARCATRAVASSGADSNRPTNLGGLAAANINTITDSYWDTATSGQSASNGGVGQTTAELRAPTGYAGIYANWNVNLDSIDGGDAPWNFGSDSQYQILYFTRQPGQRPAADSGAEDAAFVDYDADDDRLDDRLIEVKTLAQLNAIRCDLDGDGSASNVAYNLAFPNRDTVTSNANGRIAACQGYELAADLDFDTNGNGSTHTDGEGDRGDTYYNGGAGFAPICGHENASSVNTLPFAAILEGNGHTISNLYINLSTAGNNEGYYVAPFGRLTGTVRNVGLVNPYIKNTRTGVTGYIYTGALAGWSSRAVTVSRSYVSGGSVAGNRETTAGDQLCQPPAGRQLGQLRCQVHKSDFHHLQLRRRPGRRGQWEWRPEGHGERQLCRWSCGGQYDELRQCGVRTDRVSEFQRRSDPELCHRQHRQR